MFTHQNTSAVILILTTITMCATAMANDAWPSDFEWISPQIISLDTQEIQYKWHFHLSPSHYFDCHYGTRLYLSQDQRFDADDFLLFGSEVASLWVPPGAIGFTADVTIKTTGRLFSSLPRSGEYYVFLEVWAGPDAPTDTNSSNNATMAPNPVTVIGIGTVIYVDDDAAGSNDGLSWENAYNHLQDALARAGAKDEIRVAQGTYTPDRSSRQPDRTGDRTATFQLKNDVSIRGGFAGVGEPDPDVRDTEVYKTFLSGDLIGDDAGGPDDPSRAENSYHVVTGSGTNETAELDGFTINAGNADGSQGGGMVINEGSPTLAHCAFVGNSADEGGGMYNGNGSRPNLSSCGFSGNSADRGGGMYNDLSEPTLTNCIFSGNLADAGGGMYDAMSSPVLANSTFSGNSATDQGGGLYDTSASDSMLLNCILWHNLPDQVWRDAASAGTIAYSNVQGGHPGEGNIDMDPLFAAPDYWDTNGTPNDASDDFWADGDYHLMSEAGRWEPNARTWVTDGVTSPCIDAGDPSFSVGSESKPHGGRINMGAHGGTAEASRSLRDVEGFETGDFIALNWALDGDALWTVTSGTSHSGMYSARAGSISDDESCTLSVTLDCVAGDITFWCKISSESGFDSLRFYIDGAQQGEWSGQHDWAEVSFPVTAGTHTFEWTYSKDGSVSQGEDTVWIDDIVLPVE